MRQQRVRVVGMLGRIFPSSQEFKLILDDGTVSPGILVLGNINSFTSLLNKRVVVHGKAVYQPSGHFLRLEAELITDGTAEPEIWSRIPPDRSSEIDPQQFRKPQTPESGVANLFGKWPGDETDEGISEILKRMG